MILDRDFPFFTPRYFDMYTSLERLEMIARAKAQLELLPKDPTRCIACADAVEDAISFCNVTWDTLGVTAQEYESLLKQAAIACGQTYLDRFHNKGQRDCWITTFEMVVERFKLDYSEFGLTRTAFLRLKHWTAKIPSRIAPENVCAGTVSPIRPISELARIHIPKSR